MTTNAYRNRSQWFITRDFVLGEDYTDSHEEDDPLIGRGVVLDTNVERVIFPAASTPDFQGIIVLHSQKGTAGDENNARARVVGLPVSVMRHGFFPDAIAGAAIALNDLLMVDDDGFWRPAPVASIANLAAFGGIRAIAREAVTTAKDRFLIELC